MSADHRVAVAVLIHEGKILLQHRDLHAKLRPGKWGLFGGHIEPGETPLQAVIREVKEELEIDIAPMFLGTYVDQTSYGLVERHVFVQAINQPIQQLQRQQHEGDDCAYFTLEEAKTLKDFEDYNVKILEDALRLSATVSVRPRS